MQVIDDREIWLGLGYILGGIRFSVSVAKASDRPAGYRVRSSVRWQRPVAIHAERAVSEALFIAGLKVQESYDTQPELMAWVAFILRMDDAYNLLNMFADQEGLHMFLWVYDNPPPRSYEEFIEWAEAYDAEIEALGSSLLKEPSEGDSHD